MRKRRLLAISALKGGVGKTTTAVNLAAACARAGRRVLLVDVDPQGCVGSSIGLGGDVGLDAWLVGEAAFEDVVARENRPNLDVVVAGAPAPGRGGPAAREGEGKAASQARAAPRGPRRGGLRRDDNNELCK
ncbi:MAG: AAA family ATPase [Holophagales bacterium]|nr:AAA family ATPase [Holophagales bacterium]